MVENTISLKEIVTENLTIQKENEESYHIANFAKFLEYFTNKNCFSGASWNKHREDHNKDQQNRRKIVLKEISQLDSKVNFIFIKDPLTIINEDYLKDVFSQHLLSLEVKNFENLLNEDINMKLLEKRETLEMIKKIIEYYLNYVVELNFDSISKFFIFQCFFLIF